MRYSLSSSSDPESMPKITMEIEGQKKDGQQIILLSLISIANLSRNINQNLIPIGIFSRIYLNQNISTFNYQSTDQSQRNQYLKSKKVHLKHNKLKRNLKFHNEHFEIDLNQFPIRISVYYFDKNDVRFCIGHCNISYNCVKQLTIDQSDKLVLVFDLHQTVSRANYNCNDYQSK